MNNVPLKLLCKYLGDFALSKIYKDQGISMCLLEVRIRLQYVQEAMSIFLQRDHGTLLLVMVVP